VTTEVDETLFSDLPAGLVFLTGFVQLDRIDGDRDPNDLLRKMVDRRVGAVMPPGQPGADLMVPYLDTETSSFGVALVQVKNHDESRGQPNDTAAADLLRPGHVFGDVVGDFKEKWTSLASVGVHMELGSSRRKVVAPPKPSRQSKRLAVKRLDANVPTLIYEGLMLQETCEAEEGGSASTEVLEAVHRILVATVDVSSYTGSVNCGALVPLPPGSRGITRRERLPRLI